MITRFVAFAFLFTFTVNGQESSLAAGFRTPAGAPQVQPSNFGGSHLYLVHEEDSADAHPSSTTGPVTSTSLTVDGPRGQLLEAERERERLAQLQEQLAVKEQELADLRNKTAAAASQVTIEKTRADTLAAQLTQKEQELSGICAQRDTHQQLSQDLNRTKSNLEHAKQHVIDVEREVIVANEQLGDATHRLAEKEQELQTTKSNLDKMTHTLADLDRELTERNTQLTQAKQLLASLGRSLPKDGDPAASSNGPETGQAGPVDLSKVSENLASALQDELKRGSVALRQRGNKLTLALASGEVFAQGDATMTATGTSLLERIGAALQQFRNQRIEVAGHTDSIPVRSDNRRPFRDNLELSRARAQHASQTLIDSGLGADRIKPVGYAATKPIASNKTAEGRSKNRRVEIIVTPWSTSASKGKKVEQVVNKPGQQKKAVQKIINR
ncbi:MAG: OmpA family protein [Nitrospira sp.]|nr:OmpA family protein [Nitrospira sp.]